MLIFYSYVTAATCTYPDSSGQVLDKRIPTSERTVYSTVSVCPAVSTATSIITSIATSLTTLTTTERQTYATLTLTAILADPDYFTQTITATATPTCTTATAYVVTATEF